MSKKDILKIALSDPDSYLKLMETEGMRKKDIKKLKKATAEVMESINTHMEKDGWPLNYRYQESDIVEKFLPSLGLYFMSTVMTAGYKLKLSKKKGWLIKK